MPRPSTAPAGFLLPWESTASVYTRNSGHANVHAHRPTARINKQFKYGRKEFHDSVDSLPARQQVKTPLDVVSVQEDEYSAAPSELTEDTTQMYRVDFNLTNDPASLFYNPPEKQKQIPSGTAADGGTGFGFGKASSVLSTMRRPFTSGGYKTSTVVPLNNNFVGTTPSSVRPSTAGAAFSNVAATAWSGKSKPQGVATGGRSVQSGYPPEMTSVMGNNSQSWALGRGGATTTAGGYAGDYNTLDGGQSMTLGEGEDSQLLQPSQSQLGWQSDDAIRSNYLSVQSTNPGILVPVKMQRYRKMRKIDTRRVKGGFHLISRDSKEHKLEDRKKYMRQRLKEINEGLL